MDRVFVKKNILTHKRPIYQIAFIHAIKFLFQEGFSLFGGQRESLLPDSCSVILIWILRDYPDHSAQTSQSSWPPDGPWPYITTPAHAHSSAFILTIYVHSNSHRNSFYKLYTNVTSIQFHLFCSRNSLGHSTQGNI